MKRIILLCAGIFLPILFLSAQNENKDEDKEKKNKFDPSKITVDGNVGINTNNGVLNIVLSPQVSYPVLEKLYVGLGPNLSYVSDLTSSNISFNYGGNVFSRFFFTKNIYAQAESELLNFQSGIDANGTPIRKWTNSILLGGGYNKSIGNGISASFTVLYIVNHNAGSSPYNSPLVIRGGVNKRF